MKFRQKRLGRVAIPFMLGSAVFNAGCSISPLGLDVERNRAGEIGRTFEPAFENRVFPELPETPSWRAVLERAFLVNGELEAAYFEWSAALARVGISSAYPNTNLSLGYSYAFSSDNIKSFDRMAFSAGFDPMENLAIPSKVAKAGEAALAEARAAGEIFRAKKFDLQKRVLTAWTDYALLNESLGIMREQVELSALALETAKTRVQTGGPQADFLWAEVALQIAEDKVKTLEAELGGAKSGLNGMLGRPADATLNPPQLIEQRPIRANDTELLAVAVDRNPELAALARQVEGRADALELARLQWIPDINPSLMFSGSIAQAVGATIVLPTTIGKIRGRIEEAREMLRSAEAQLRQAQFDRGSAFVAALLMLRNSERQTELFERSIVPATEQILETTTTSYSSGDAAYLELIDSQRSLLEARQGLIEARATREKRLAEVEALAGVDLETIKTDGREAQDE